MAKEETMSAGGPARLVLVTCRSLAEGRRIACEVVRKRLAACVNIVLSPVESFYMWKGKAEKAREYLLVIKSTEKRLKELELQVKKLHSYEVPEFLVLPVVGGSKKYLEWVAKSVK